MKHKLWALSTITFLAMSSSIVEASDVASVIPTQKPGLAVTITGLYLKPSANNLQYGVFTNPLPLPAPNWQQKIVNPSYSGAFDLAVQYNLMDGRESAKLNWLHFNSTDSASASSNGQTSVGPAYYFGPAEQFLLNTGANSRVKFNVDSVNLVFGHSIDLSNHIQVQPFIGLSAVYLREKIANNYWGADPVYGPYTHDVYSKSTFTGFGPRIGFNGSYFVTNRFAVTGSIAGDLLAGGLQYNTNFTSWTGYTAGALPHNNIPANTSMANQNLTRIVPELDAQLALLYSVPFDKGSALTLQAGYTYAVYFDAINQVLPGTVVPGSWEAGSVAIINQVQQQSNVDLRGPFLSVSWLF